MSSTRGAPPDLAALKAAFEDLQRQIRDEEDPAEMEAARRAFRQVVPFFFRSYVGAYLLRQAVQGRPRRRSGGVTLFVSIGKNRRVYPRDLVQLFCAAGGLTKADIGDIKILDNYSFVDVDEAKAADAIAKLDTAPFRGRPLTVNFAKKRNGEDAGSGAQVDH